MLLICHMNSHNNAFLKGYAILLVVAFHHSVMFGGHWFSASGDITYDPKTIM